MFADRLRLFGDSVALKIEGGLSVSYRELADRVEQRAAELGDQRCLIILEATLALDSVVAYLAALRGRHPIILTEAEHPGAPEALAALFHADVMVAPDGAVRRADVQRKPGALDPNLAVLLSTSGSTGSTKLVRLSYRNIQSNAESIGSYLQLVPEDAGALTLPLHYSYGLSVLNSHLVAGAALCMSQRSLTDPALFDWLAAAGCTNISGVPYSYEIFERLDVRNRRLDRLRFMTAAGGRLPEDRVRVYAEYFRRRGGQFFVMYGQTEATARIAYLPPEAASDHADCIGIPIPGGELLLVDDQGNRIERRCTPGELVYRGPNVMMGYATTSDCLAKGSELEELHTGDLGERTEAGFFRIVGRKSRFSKLSGLRVSHDDIEHHLKAAGIAAVVTGNDERLVVALTDQADAAPATAHIIAFSSVQPSQLKVLSLRDLPRLSSGKIDYPALCRLAGGDPTTAPDSVLDAFSQAFWPRLVTPGDTFLSLGGDSLTFVGLVVALEAIRGRVPENWERMTVAEISAESRAPAGWSRVDPNVYIRAIAILAVVVHHLADWGYRGGAFVLMTMVGYSLARFQSPALFKGQLTGVVRPLLRNLLLYYVVILPLMAWEDTLRWPELLLISNVVAFPGKPILYNTYWFVEAYACIVAAVVVLCSFPWLRREVSRRPLGLGIAALIVTVLLIFAGRLTWNDSWTSCSQGPCLPTTEVAYWAAIGWCLYFADTTRRKVGVLILAAFIILALDYGLHDGVNPSVVVCLAPLPLLTWRVRLALPGLFSAAASYLAANSYLIYLLHLIPLAVAWQYGVHVPGPEVFRDLLSVTVGIGFSLVAATVLRGLTGVYRTSRAGTGPRTTAPTGTVPSDD